VNAAARRALSALGVAAIVALALAGAVSTGLSLRDARAEVAVLSEQDAALQAREQRLAPRPGRDASVAPFFEARTITQAGAALQQRLEAAVAAAHGRLISSKVEVAPRDDERRINLAVELTIAEPDMQALLFDLEAGRPYLFVDAFEARATQEAGEPGGGAMRVALSVSGEWSKNP
jgi:general secretion pathway protein M